jgi:WS/DGAT/MGAT family acyltransferase
LRRISPLDASNLRVERSGLPMTVAAMATVEAAGVLSQAAGAVDLEAVRRHVASRVALEPRLREVLLPTRWWQGPPPWVQDTRFDIGSHVRGTAVPSPGDETTLLRLCCELNRPFLDPTRSPWELWVISGRDDGTLALVLRLHHVMADGAAALRLLGALFDPAPDRTPPEVRRPAARPPGIRQSDLRLPSATELLLDNLHRHGAGIRRTGARLGQGLRPAILARRAAVTVGLARLLLAGGRAPALSFNRPVTTERRLTLVRADLAKAKAAAHSRDATVNDLLLTAIGQGARALLQKRGELRQGLVLHVSVPTSLRPAEEAEAAGNRVAVRLMLVPLDEPDPGRQLAALALATKKVKRLPPLQPSGALGQRWMVRVMRRQRLVNLLVSNVAGPTAPLWFGGGRVRELFQIGVVQGNLAITVGSLSYAGQLNIEIASDAVLVPDIEVFAEGVTRALTALGCVRSNAGPLGAERPPPVDPADEH